MAVQTALADLGCESAATAGILDATTQKALRQFQSTHQLPAHGNLTKNTLVALFDERCKHGCKMTVLVSATPENQANRSPVTRIQLAGTGWWPVFVQGMQTMLTQQGYETSGADSDLGSTMQQAIRAFQHASHLTGDGEVTGETVLALLAASCQNSCEFALAILPQEQAPEQPTVRKLPPALPPASTSLQLHGVAYASEKVECSSISGDWVTLSRGTVVERDAQSVALRLEERFGYRYYPTQEGLNRTDWWCIPRRRHCYAPISFSDWGGTFSKDSVQRFPSERVYAAQLGLINGMAILLQQQCHRNADGRKKR